MPTKEQKKRKYDKQRRVNSNVAEDAANVTASSSSEICNAGAPTPPFISANNNEGFFIVILLKCKFHFIQFFYSSTNTCHSCC